MSSSDSCEWIEFPPMLRARVREHAKALGLSFNQAVVRACWQQFGAELEPIADPWAGKQPEGCGKRCLTENVDPDMVPKDAGD